MVVGLFMCFDSVRNNESGRGQMLVEGTLVVLV